MLEQKLRALKSFRQCFTHRLLDHTRTGEANQRTGFGDHYVAHEGEAGGHAAHGRVGQHRDERQPFLAELRQRGASFRHLHQRQQSFLHARTAAGGETNEWTLLLQRNLYAAHETFAHHRAH